jgi:hypothetical protein
VESHDERFVAELPVVDGRVLDAIDLRDEFDPVEADLVGGGEGLLIEPLRK